MTKELHSVPLGVRARRGAYVFEGSEAPVSRCGGGCSYPFAALFWEQRGQRRRKLVGLGHRRPIGPYSVRRNADARKLSADLNTVARSASVGCQQGT
jgi:hypothetical protein